MNPLKDLPLLNVVIIVQARMGATRLPGKPLLKVMGKTLLEYLIHRLKRVKLAKELIVATTVASADDAIVECCKELGVKTFRGNEEDVLARYQQAAQATDAEVIVRITADCPLVDPDIINQMLYIYLSRYPEIDYISNTLERSYARGMDVEIFSRKALETAHQEAVLEEEREHVTPYIYRHPEKFHIEQMKYPMDLSLYRWTVDTSEDFTLIKIILEEIYPHNTRFTFEDLVGLLDRHPEWSSINAHINQKKIT